MYQKWIIKGCFGTIFSSTGFPKKNAILTLEANISGLKPHIGESRTSFENCMFSAFIWPQKQVNSVPASLRKTGFEKLT